MLARKHFQVLTAAGILALAATATAVAAGEVRLRVEVDDAVTGEQRVRLNIPLNSVESMLDIFQDELDVDFLREVDTHGVRLRDLYLAIRDEDLSDFLEVQDRNGEHVKIWKDQEAFYIQVQEAGRSEPNVNVYLPLSVMDALLLDGDAPDLQAAMDELRRLAPLTLVEVDHDDEIVRIWLE